MLPMMIRKLGSISEEGTYLKDLSAYRVEKVKPTEKGEVRTYTY